MGPKTTLLLSLLFIKHFWADFVVQDKETATYKGERLSLLIKHSFLHSILTFSIIFALGFPISLAFWVFLFELVVHAVIDYLKANKFLDFPALVQKNPFSSLGLDQLLHALTYIAIAHFLSV